MFNGLYLKRVARTVLEVLPFFALLFLVNPSLIMTSDKNFVLHWDVLYTLLISCVASSCFIATFITLMSDKYYIFFIALFRSLFLLFFVVTILFPIASEIQDGQEHKTLGAWAYLLNYTVYFIVICISVYIFLSRNIFSNVLSKLFVIMAAYSAGVFIFNLYELSQGAFNTKMYSENTDLSFGAEKNIVFIMADMLQGSTLEQFFVNNLEEKKGFEGFTFYSRAVSPFPFTSYGVPAILTGDTYINGQKAPQKEVLKHTQENSLLQDPIPYGYDRSVVSIEWMNVDKSQYTYGKDLKNLVAQIVALGLKRIFKQSILNLPPPSIAFLISLKETSRDIMKRLAYSTIGKSSFKLIYVHNMIPHVPTVFTSKELHSKAKTLTAADDTIENYWLETSFFLGQVRSVLEQMKRLGIYDNSLIVITGDHGHFISKRPEFYKNKRGTEDFHGADTGSWARFVGMYNAAILIKPPLSSSQPLKVTRAASSTTGIRSVIQKYLSEENYQKINFLDHFENNSKQKAIVFKNDIKSNPYQVPDDHVQCEFEGNITVLRKIFIDSRYQDIKAYTIGTNLNPANECLNEHWLKEASGAWLLNTAGEIGLKLEKVDDSKEHILRLELQALTNDKHPQQRVRILMNDKDLGVHTYSGLVRQSQDIIIPSNMLLSNKINRIEFEPLDSISPKELGLWDSNAQISIFLFSLQLLRR